MSERALTEDQRINEYKAIIFDVQQDNQRLKDLNKKLEDELSTLKELQQ